VELSQCSESQKRFMTSTSPTPLAVTTTHFLSWRQFLTASNEMCTVFKASEKPLPFVERFLLRTFKCILGIALRDVIIGAYRTRIRDSW